jgi:hypothetical protein
MLKIEKDWLIRLANRFQGFGFIGFFLGIKFQLSGF